MIAVLRQPAFFRLWLGGLVSNASDWVLAIALPVFVYDLTGLTLATGGMLLAQSLPRLGLGLFAGVLVDRWDRRRLMIAADLGRCALLPLLLLVRSPDRLPLLYAVAAAEAVLSLFFVPAQAALVPRIVGEGDLLAANGVRALGWELTRLGAPPVGGLLMAAHGLPAVVLLDSASFLASAVLLWRVTIPRGPDPNRLAGDAPEREARRSPVWRDLVAGLRVVGRDPLLRVLVVVGGLGMVGEGIINVLGFPWVARALGGGAAERGWLATAQAVGGIAGGLAVQRFTAPALIGRVIGAGGLLFGILSVVLTNVALLPIGEGARWPLVLLLRALSGAPLVVLFVALDTLLVRGVDDRFRGRVVAVLGVTNGGALVVGQALASALGDPLGVVPVLTLQGVLYVIAGLASLALIPRYLTRAHDRVGGDGS